MLFHPQRQNLPHPRSSEDAASHAAFMVAPNMFSKATLIANPAIGLLLKWRRICCPPLTLRRKQPAVIAA